MGHVGGRHQGVQRIRGDFVVVVPTPMHIEWMEQRLYRQLEEALQTLTGLEWVSMEFGLEDGGAAK